MQVVASRVQIKQSAVSYPGVGRFRRAETGILGRAIKGVPLGLPFLFAHWRSRRAFSPRSISHLPPKRAGETPALQNSPFVGIYFRGLERSCPLHARKTALVGCPKWRAALVAGYLNVVKRSEDFCDGGKFVALDGPLCEEFAIAICDEHAAADESARCERVLA